MGPALLGLLDDVAASSGMQGVASREYSFVETNVGVKPTLDHIGNADVVGASSWLDAVFTAVLQDKGTASRGHRELVLVKSRRLLAITPHLHGLRVVETVMWHHLLLHITDNTASLLRVAGSTKGVCYLLGSVSRAPS